MLPLLEALLRASPKVKSFQIVDADPIDQGNFLFKIRCELTSGQTLQIRLRAVAGHIHYSYQEFTPIRKNNRGICGVMTGVTDILIFGLQLY